jgi:hypothetical protein
MTGLAMLRQLALSAPAVKMVYLFWLKPIEAEGENDGL